LLEGIKPNKAHERLALLEKRGKLKAVITQNIDGLHQMAGSKEVMELHGSVLRNYCMKCGKFHDVEDIKAQSGVPKCECGGIIKPDVVLYEEGLDNMTITKSIQYISNADVLIIGGTSLVVYPAAGLIDYYRGKKLVLINMQPTPQDDRADLVIRGKIGEIMSQVVEE
jgi:NAD-dependent deacetylase